MKKRRSEFKADRRKKERDKERYGMVETNRSVKYLHQLQIEKAKKLRKKKEGNDDNDKKGK